MSDALVPSASAPSRLPQQGSFDWVALFNTSVQFPVAVLSRLSKAGIDALTLQVGRAICSNFALEPQSQERMSDAVLKLKRYGSYGDLIWFGFGIKGVVSDLTSTEEGLTLVALCAALSTSYDSLFVARVLRELCILCRAPESLSPALRQWKALTELCAGILMSSNFALRANGIRRLISALLLNAAESRCGPTTYSALAEALSTLALISKNKLINATFTGGLDCAWLAAFAESVLSLDVGIWDSASTPIYRSRGSAEDVPQVTIVVSDRTGTNPKRLLTSKASVLPCGSSLLQTDSGLEGASPLNWQASWSTILHEVFHSDIDILLSGQVGHQFALYLDCVSCLHIGKRKDSDGRHANLERALREHPVNTLLWTGRGTHFLVHASRRLPELSTTLSEYSPAVHAGMPLDTILEVGKASLESIEAACFCSLHCSTRNNQAEAEKATQFCLRKISETVVIFLWILISCEIGDDVSPSVTGLANLFTRQSGSHQHRQEKHPQFYDSIFPSDYPAFGIDLVFLVLSGSMFSQLPIPRTSMMGSLADTEHLTTNTLARVGNGICVHHYAVEDPTGPIETMFKFHVVRGYIYHSGSRYKELSGMESEYLGGDLYPVSIHDELDEVVRDSVELVDLHSDLTARSLQAVIQETDDERRLEITYKICYPERSSQRTVLWLHLPALYRKLRQVTGSLVCPGNCNALWEPGNSLTRYHNEFNGQTFEVTGTFERRSYDRAQEVLQKRRQSWDTWILVNEPATYFVISGRPLLLYALLSQFGGCYLTPYTTCLHCIIIQGIRSQLLPYREQGPDEERSFTTTLITSEKSKAVIKRTQQLFRN